MYDDLLGKRREQPERTIAEELDIGKCFQCSHMRDNSTSNSPRTVFVYCNQIKKYIHSNQVGCLLFKRKRPNADFTV